MNDEHTHFQARITITKGFEVHCDAHGVIAFVESMAEAKAEAIEHRTKHHPRS